MDGKRYADFGTFLKKYFSGKVQKVSINAGFTCPNRDGTKGNGGCTYCNNQTFSPEYCHTEKTISEQLFEGIDFFGRKYPDMKYLAYFQAYTNTYGEFISLRDKYEEALRMPRCRGIDYWNCVPIVCRSSFFLIYPSYLVVVLFWWSMVLNRLATKR